VIPANDDATKSIELVLNILCQAIEEGLSERKLEKDKEIAEETAEGEALANPTGKKLRARKSAKPVDVATEAPAEPAAEPVETEAE
jgi:small subunit ribosomal protein S2